MDSKIIGYLKGGVVVVAQASTIKKRNEVFQFQISSGHQTQGDEEPRPVICLCIMGHRGTTARRSWRNNHPKLSLAPPASPSIVPPQNCHLVELSQSIHRPALLSVSSSTNTLVSECLKATWKRLISKHWALFSWITKDLMVGTQWDVVPMDKPKVFISLYDEEDSKVPPEIFGDIYDSRLTNGIISCHTDDKTDESTGDLNNSTPHWHRSLWPDSSEECQCEMITTDFNSTSNLRSLLKPSRSAPVISSIEDKDRIKRKSVSFVDDVTMYLFDQESPTMELQCHCSQAYKHAPEECPSVPCSYPHSLPDLSLGDDGFEWEDDFSALDWALTTKRNCRQCITPSDSSELSVSQPCIPVPALATQSWTGVSRSQRFCISPSYLVLTHVTESDLEL